MVILVFLLLLIYVYMTGYEAVRGVLDLLALEF